MDYIYASGVSEGAGGSSVLAILTSIIALVISIWVIYLIYSINKGIKETNKKLGRGEDANIVLFLALEAGDKELCKKILDERARVDYYKGAERYFNSPVADCYDEEWDLLKKELESYYSEMYKLCDVEPIDFARLGDVETYKTLFTHIQFSQNAGERR